MIGTEDGSMRCIAKPPSDPAALQASCQALERTPWIPLPANLASMSEKVASGNSMHWLHACW